MATDLEREKYALADLFLRDVQRRLKNGTRIVDRNGCRLRSVHEVVNAILAGTYPVERGGERSRSDE